ncbi:hypothetical protein H2203_008557 [Taxawa tesnikishii (nom. ined.)]|nr:hypothetical protein H2203_008557 [Dothideales sp. JES 119]
MSSDEDYAAFLEKANQDTGAKVERDGSFVKTKAVDTEVPGPLKSLDAFYTSETDEPFEPVALEWKGGGRFPKTALLPCLGAGGKTDDGTDLWADGFAEEFGELVGHSGEVEKLKLEEWNVKNRYEDVVEAVRKSGDGEVEVFRVNHGKTRCEYYVVALAKGKIVGVKARAVET